MSRIGQAGSLRALSQPAAAPAPVRILLLGAAASQQALLSPCGWLRVEQLPHAALDAAALARILPDCVVTPLLSPGPDALEVAVRLLALGYRGRLCVLGVDLPDRRMVVEEIAAAAPGIEVCFLARLSALRACARGRTAPVVPLPLPRRRACG